MCHIGVGGCTTSGKESDKVVSEDILNDEIVSEQLTRYHTLLPINLTFLLHKLFVM